MTEDDDPWNQPRKSDRAPRERDRKITTAIVKVRRVSWENLVDWSSLPHYIPAKIRKTVLKRELRPGFFKPKPVRISKTPGKKRTPEQLKHLTLGYWPEDGQFAAPDYGIEFNVVEKECWKCLGKTHSERVFHKQTREPSYKMGCVCESCGVISEVRDVERETLNYFRASQEKRLFEEKRDRMKEIMRNLTEPEKELIRGAALQVWGEVAYDCFGEGMPKTMSRKMVIEVVTDASRMEQVLKKQGQTELAAKVEQLDLVELTKILKPAFPELRYGL